MDRDTERDVWALHDRRLGEQDTKIHDTNRAIESLDRDVRALTERINMGVSPTQNKILEKQSAIELELTNFKHSLELAMKDMKDNMEKQTAVIVVEQQIQGRTLDAIRKIFIYGLVAGVLAAGVKATIDHFSSERPQVRQKK